MIEGLLLILAGVGLVGAMVLVLRSGTARRRLYRSNERFRALARMRPAEPEVFARHFEVAIYVGMCSGGVIALLGVLVAAN